MKDSVREVLHSRVKWERLDAQDNSGDYVLRPSINLIDMISVDADGSIYSGNYYACRTILDAKARSLRTFMEKYGPIFNALPTLGLTIEATARIEALEAANAWNTDMESAPKSELILARTKARTYHTVYWDGYEGGTWWIAGTTLKVTPTAWRPITPPQEAET